MLPKLLDEGNASALDGILDAVLVYADKGPCDSQVVVVVVVGMVVVGMVVVAVVVNS